MTVTVIMTETVTVILNVTVSVTMTATATCTVIMTMTMTVTICSKGPFNIYLHSDAVYHMAVGRLLQALSFPDLTKT